MWTSSRVSAWSSPRPTVRRARRQRYPVGTVLEIPSTGDSVHVLGRLRSSRRCRDGTTCGIAASDTPGRVSPNPLAMREWFEEGGCYVSLRNAAELYVPLGSTNRRSNARVGRSRSGTA